MKQKDTVLRARAVPLRNGRKQAVKLGSGVGVDLDHINGVGPPNIVLPRDGVLEG
jgi:hypothetical protein